MRRHLPAAIGLAALLAFPPATSAVAQPESPETCLALEPEYSRSRADSGKFLVATVHEKIPGSDYCDGPTAEDGDPVWIDFELFGVNDTEEGAGAGDTPDTPDATCRIDPAWVVEARCTIALWGRTGGRQFVRAWIDRDGADPPNGLTEADRDEGTDDTSETGTGCPLSGDLLAPREAEPDCTDVVFVDWAGANRCYRTDEGARPERIAMLRREPDASPMLHTVHPVSVDVRRVTAREGIGQWLWSPDRERIAYTTGHLNGRKLWTTTPGPDVLLTRNRRLDKSPAWAPDSRRIVYASHDYFANRRPQLYVVGIDGTGTRRLTNAPTADDHPDWSPDGRRIVFERQRRTEWGDTNGIYSIRPSGRGLRRLVSSDRAALALPQYSPNGNAILFRKTTGRRSELYVMRRDGSNPRAVVESREPIVDFEWSPHGRRIVYETRSSSGWSEVWVKQGSRLRRLVSHFGLDAVLSPTWSPGSEYVAYQLPYAHHGAGGESFASDVWIHSLEHLCAEVLTNTRKVDELGPVWVTQSASGGAWDL